MNTLMNLDSLSLLEELLDSSSRAFRTMHARATGRFPPVNVATKDNTLLVDLELPGKTAQEIVLTLEAQALTIADRPTVRKEESSPRPAWSRRLELPYRVNTDKTTARFINGILHIELPKEEKANIKTIAIEG